ASELLDAYLDANPQMQEFVSGIEEAVSVTEIAVSSRPDMFREEGCNWTDEADPETKLFPFPGLTWLKVAAAFALLAVTGAGGYLAGNRTAVSDLSSSTGPASTSLLSNSTPGPWAQYRIASGGIETSIPTPSTRQQP
ncbi:MAG: hypothetical protein P1V20_26245, partial [Verrucomicrobiales bacterium]|nr:hypothetical protein [Verrucomicrobiales bacterium]